jgi:hypothetical protein
MRTVSVCRRGDRLMMRTVKATLLVMALTRLAIISVRAGAKHVRRIAWQGGNPLG